MGVEAQLKALTGNLMIWLLREEPHPVRKILRGHIFEASQKEMGNGGPYLACFPLWNHVNDRLCTVEDNVQGMG